MKHFESYSLRLQKRKKILDFIKYFVFIFISFEILINYFIKTYRIENDIMAPNLLPGNHVIASSLRYGINIPFSYKKLLVFDMPKRGDIVLISQNRVQGGVFYQTGNAIIKFFTFQQIHLPRPSTNSYHQTVRRIIGIPGDTIYMNDFLVYNKTKASLHYLSEYEVSQQAYDLVVEKSTFWPEDLPFSSKFDEITLGENQYFVMSDNRSKINDSRYWGVITLDDIVAKILFVYWPYKNMRKM